jgi:uncharacterized repeat protein (TIGR02543 family)
MIHYIIRFGFLVIVAATGSCFSPSFQDGKIECGPGGSCPPGLQCFDNVCHASAPGPRDGSLQDSSTDAPADAAVDAPPGTVTLTVSAAGTGTGSVTATGIDCPGDCTETVEIGTELTLSASYDVASTDFIGWTGACAGAATTTTCTITLTGDTSVGARFELKKRTVTVVIGGNGTGTVTSNVGGINCPGTCSAMIDHGSSLVLTGTQGGSSTFLGWSGVTCPGTTPCTVTATSDVTVNASFALDYSLVVTRVGTSSNGTVTSSPAGISCPGTCTATYTAGTPVMLTASPGAETIFVGFEGGCSGPTCNVTINAAVAVAARFDLVKYSLDVAKTGMGTVASTNVAGISCGTDCDDDYDSGQTVTLSATNTTAGWTFTGWGGACSSSGSSSTCTVTMTQARSVTATFTINSYALNVTKTGAGTGTVTSSPAGINCVNGGGTCSANFNHGTMVMLTATPAAGTTFTGWTGENCTTGTCMVTMTQARSVTANFVVTNYTLTIVPMGNGMGSITGTGINCGNGNNTCSATVPYNTSIVLTATPASSSNFTGFAGGSCGGSPCTVTVTANTTVNATFTLKQYLVTAAKAGTGSGSISATRAGSTIISSCNGSGGDCTETVDHGTQIVITGSPSTGSSFTSWSGGGCTTTNPCTSTITADTTITGTFTINTYVLTVNKTGSMTGGLGTVTSSPSGISCGTTCTSTTASYNYNTNVTLTASVGTGHRFLGWAGYCTNTTGTCVVPMTAARTVSAKFTRHLNCTSVTNAAGCSNGSIPNLLQTGLTAAQCELYCENHMYAVGMTAGCWIIASNNACYCRDGTLTTGGASGTQPGGSCTL